MKTPLFVLCLGLSFCLSAQEVDFYPTLSVKLSPFSALDPLTSTFAGSFTLRPIPRLGLHFEYGWQYENLKPENRTSSLINSRYYEIRPEIQWFTAYGKNKEAYLALEGFYIPHIFSLEYGYITGKGNPIEFDAADGQRFTHGLVLKGGAQFILNKYLIFEGFGGFGYRRREINIFNLVNPRDGRATDRSLWGNPLTMPGVKHRLHLSLGIRIGVILARKRMTGE